MASVVGLGYAVVEATDLDRWERFACGLLGLQAAERTADRLMLRMDDKEYRLDIRRGAADRVTAVGWEVRGERELQELMAALTSAGYSPRRGGPDQLRERGVSGLATFDDPNGQRLELFYALKGHREAFVSPTGARFVTCETGLGHVFQVVEDKHAFDVLYQDVLGFRLSDYIESEEGLVETFLHVNPRHHSFAYGEYPGAQLGVHHLMFEVDDLDVVGRAWHKAEDGAAPVTMSLGKHSNDKVVSFYVQTPSGFEVEYGFGGLLIDDDFWTPSRYDVDSYWGHKGVSPGLDNAD